MNILLTECLTSLMGLDYLGKQNVTQDGVECQRWDRQYPHHHNRTDIARYPDATLSDAHNYCRNPDLEPGGPWCFTTDPRQRWMYCEITLCSK